MIKRRLALFALAASAMAGACQKESAPAAAPTPVTPGATTATVPALAAPPTGHAVIEGTVKLNGTPPEMAPTRRDADPFCAKTPMKDEEVVVGPGGGLANVVVRVTDGATGHYDPPATPAALDQSACMYRPRVQAIVAGQMISIRNGDQTLHNVHGYKGASTLFNQAEIPGLPPLARKIGDAGDVLKFKCDVHPWMTGYVIVNANPFFAVTGPDGRFKIAGLPPGRYTLTAWQERYGAKTAQVTVAADKPAEVSFAYDAK
ncbi:MAG TPA: carboxypeptidase regulatory-like domain-containing protein [Polyangia bacterium]|jgi:plastocyanin|nr:carboxypeptidase regulatory-like domain-containing protein [Polyangia bacterium]